MHKLRIPYKYKPRDYQLPLLKAMDSGTKRAICIWHRRAGKDKTLINLIAKKIFERKGVYYYFFPTYTQARKILWDGIDKDGFALLNHFPKKLIKKKNDQEMKLIFKNGSIFQCLGTENPHAIRGTNPIGCIFSEYAYQNPQIWEIISPILLENNGWAVFNTTPNGKNHAYRLYKMAKKNPDWFAEKLTIENTGVITKKMLEKEQKEGLDQDFIQRDYFCSFEGSTKGSYYSKELKKAFIGKIKAEKEIPVDTWWDLGMSDSTAIIFTQNIGKKIYIIDYLEASGEGLEFYINELRKKPYKYGFHYAPHDIKVRELGSGKSRIEIARNLGINFQIIKNIPLIDGINAVRKILPFCAFDEKKCARLLDALDNYKKAFNEKTKEFQSYPLHDWSSHGADAFRYLAVGHKEKEGINKRIIAENKLYSRKIYDTKNAY